MWIGVALSSLGKPEEALPHYRCASELCGRLPHFEAMRATALVPLGRVEEARSILEYLKTRPGRDYVDPYSIFSITLMLDGLDRALPHLEEMVEVRSLFLPYLRGIPRFRALWVDPRFRGAMERVWPSD
jgi:hypothetical protein